MFYIVEFLETQEVEVVPALWVADEICQWPDRYKADELVRAIRSKEQPGHTWDAFRVRILYRAANYKTSRLKLPEADAHTDLQTAEEDEDDNPKKKRKWLRSLTSPEPRELVKSPENGRSTSPEPSCSVTSPQPHQLDESQRHSGTSTSNGLASLLHKLLTNQEMIMEQLKIIQMNLNKTGQPVQGQDPLKGDVLPLKDVAALLALEKRLREEEDLKNKMISTFSVIGGVDIKDSVWRIMQHCFTNPLAKQLNWRGINGKTAFRGLHMKNVITGSVRNNRLTATATDQEVECYIKRWLHLASDRDGGRRKREERRQTFQNICPDLANRSGPPKCHHSMRYVGRM
ncbi:uncharacterized protein LOC130427520 [Triplophysa dalaica]|uniref:uncharacterized protein LOC130427520 n=1 Tax=Triplophysa dalaica TaxID=1582913 RepID=UPI0024E01C0F|nr:uncharacterized protein LOC130427520 [Triplophysa dalaica]